MAINFSEKKLFRHLILSLVFRFCWPYTRPIRIDSQKKLAAWRSLISVARAPMQKGKTPISLDSVHTNRAAVFALPSLNQTIIELTRAMMVALSPLHRRHRSAPPVPPW
jgi:hypothetical protein